MAPGSGRTLNGATIEDPVTGSLNASVASWLTRTGRASPPYLVTQGTALGREGRVFISIDDNEVANLRKLCDEIFGEENFQGRLVPVRLIQGGIPDPDTKGEGIQLLKELTHKNGDPFNVRISDLGEIKRIR